MQRVFRSSLVGLLTIAGLAACGDKVTIPPVVTQAPPNVVHGVTVTPTSATIAVGGTTTLVASVDADQGVTPRTVTWSSSDATVASVSATGLVTGLKAGTTSIIATAAADVNVKAAAAVTVSAASPNPTVTISAINTTTCGVNGCTSTPAKLDSIGGQVDIVLNVEPNGQTLKTVQATITCGAKSLSAQQTVGNVAPVAAEAASVPITLSINTASFNSTTGVVGLNNGACTLSAVATTAAGTQSATNTTPLTLKNVDGVILTTAMSGASANDVNGLPWKAGSATVSALPVLYSGRTAATLTITLPGSTNPTQTVPAAATGATTATWSGTSTTGFRVTDKTLIGAYDVNGFPTGIHPTVLVIDSNGADLALGQLNAATQSDVRIDNTAPNQPAIFTIPNSPPAGAATGQNGWVNAAYTFTGAAAAYTTGGDIGVSNGSGVGTPSTIPAGNVPTVSPTAGTSSTTGLVGTTTLTYFAAPAASFTFVGGAAAPATGTGATACATTGLQQIATAGDLAATLVNTAYRVRVNEVDKLGNLRCTDIGGSVAAGQATFGVDKVAPTAVFNDPTSAADFTVVNIANPAIPSWSLTISDDASGFTATPARTIITQNKVGLTTPACIVGTTNSSGVCVNPANTATTLPVNGTAGTAATTEGYYTYSATVRDQAQNSAPTLARQAVVDVTAPVVGGISVPAALVGGASANFATSATDNLDLISSNYTLGYGTDLATPPAGSTGLKFRTPGPALGVAFDNVLTTASSFSVSVPLFLRNVQVTSAAGVPVAFGSPANLPTSIEVRALDAGSNTGTSGPQVIATANVVQTNPVPFNYASLSASFTNWVIANTATNICNVTAPAVCTPATNPTTVTLRAAASGVLSTFQLPFQQVQFYFFDTGHAGAANEWIFIATSTASSVTDVGAVRTFSWTTSFDPPANLGNGVALNVMAIGVNATGDALVTPNNAAIVLVP